MMCLFVLQVIMGCRIARMNFSTAGVHIKGYLIYSIAAFLAF